MPTSEMPTSKMPTSEMPTSTMLKKENVDLLTPSFYTINPALQPTAGVRRLGYTNKLWRHFYGATLEVGILAGGILEVGILAGGILEVGILGVAFWKLAFWRVAFWKSAIKLSAEK
jgi:hypothetical protein